MANTKLDPSVHEFKDFVNEHIELRRKIRKETDLIQSYYEKWVLLGPEDPFWDEFKEMGEASTESDSEVENEEQPEWMKQLVKYMKNVDVKTVQEQVHSFNKTIKLVQNMMQDFSKNKTQSVHKKVRESMLFKD